MTTDSCDTGHNWAVLHLRARYFGFSSTKRSASRRRNPNACDYTVGHETLANHESARTTGLYDRRSDKISLDEVEKIGI